MCNKVMKVCAKGEFMARTEQVTLTNMCMVYDDKGNVLVQDRKKEDWPGVTFPGGHMEPKESCVEAVIREVFEETGLMIEHPVLCGIKQFEEDNNRYMVFLYKANTFTGTLTSSNEGEVFWIPRKDIASYNLAEDMMGMLSVFEQEDISEFYYYFDEENKGRYKLL